MDYLFGNKHAYNYVVSLYRFDQRSCQYVIDVSLYIVFRQLDVISSMFVSDHKSFSPSCALNCANTPISPTVSIIHKR